MGKKMYERERRENLGTLNRAKWWCLGSDSKHTAEI